MPPCRSPFVVSPVILLLVGSCASTPEETPRVPERVVVVTHIAGDPIGGPPPRSVALALDLVPEIAFEVRARLFVVDSAPSVESTPLSEHVQLIVDEAAADPLSVASVVAPGSRVIVGEVAEDLLRALESSPEGELISTSTFEALSFPGVTAEFAAVGVPGDDPTAAEGPPWRTAIQLWRDEPDDSELSIALEFSDVVQAVQDLGDEAGPTLVLGAETETLVLDETLVAGGSPVIIAAPTRFDPSRRIHDVVVLQAFAAQEDEEALTALSERVAVARSEVRDAALEDAQKREQLRVDQQLRLRRLRSIDGLAAAETRRTAVVDLAGGSRLGLASELAVMADDLVLADFAERLRAEQDALRSVAGDADALTWRVEREALLLVSAWVDEDLIPPEYEAVLLRYTGEAGRYPGSIQDALVAVDGFDAFYDRIVEENRIALEDPSPAARVRAHDWLVQRGLGIPDFDPLAERRDRRSALQAWREELHAAAEEAAARENANGRASANDEARR